jgi:hypothetical protein
MPAERRLVLLPERYPNASRMTRWRIQREPDFPVPVIVRGRKYFVDAELTQWEEARRRAKPATATAITTT